MIVQTPLQTGAISGVVIDFPAAGDMLPMHAHGEQDVHITIVTVGTIRAHGDGWERLARPGDVLDWEIGQHHELVAVTPGARIVNILKGAPHV
jgi:quercetin dioxygenase-like cupin family protein